MAGRSQRQRPQTGPDFARLPDELVVLEELHKAFGRQQVLRGTSLTVRKGQTYAIIGKSGSGKSVTLKHIVGLQGCDRGRVWLFGEDITALSEDQLRRRRGKVGYLFQDGALLAWMTVAENVALPLIHHERLPREEVRQRVAEKLRLVGLSHAADKMPSELSGGMRKRAGLARALIREPALVLYDEPTSGLDPVMSQQINELILDLQSKLGVTSIVVTHDMKSAYTISDCIGMLYEGRIICEGSPAEMQTSDNPYVRQFIEGRTDGPIALD